MNEPLTVVLWLWNGWRPIYTNRHVNAMAGMLFDYLSLPCRIVCFTDNPDGIEVETYPIWDVGISPASRRRLPTPPQAPNSYRRLKMFSPWAAQAFPGQVWSIDLDCVIRRNIDALWTPEDFKINSGRAAPYNGAMWLLRTGTRTKAWTELTRDAPETVRKLGYVGSDQAWLSYILPKEKTWGAADGVFHYSNVRLGWREPDSCRMLFFAGAIKPWSEQCKKRMPKMFEHYARYY